MATLQNPVRDQMDRPAWLAYIERRLRPEKKKQKTSQYDFGRWLLQVEQRFQRRAVARTAKMEQVINKQDPLVKQLEGYKRANRMKTLGSFEDLLEITEGKPVVASIKVDGELTGLGFDGSGARLVSLNGRVRTNLPVTEEVAHRLQGKGPSTFVVELYGVDERNNELPYPQAISLLRDPKSERDEQRIRAAVFDVLQYDGKDVSKADYWKRLTVATNVFGDGTYIQPVYVTEDGESTVRKLWERQVLKEGHEGLVIRTDGHYKLKPVNTFDLAVMGVEQSKSHPEWAGALLLAFMDEKGNFLDAGKVGSGLTYKGREDWFKWAQQHKVGEKNGYIYVDPFAGDRVVEVRHEGLNPVARPAWKFEAGGFEPIGQLRSTALRKPAIVRIREDKHVTPEDTRIDQLPIKLSIRTIRDGAQEPLRQRVTATPPDNYYKGADAANYLLTRLILEKAQEGYGFLDSFIDQHGIARGYANYHKLDPKFVAYLPGAISEVIEARKEGLKSPTKEQLELTEEWKELWGDPLLTDEDVAAFVDQTPEAGQLDPEEQQAFAEWSDLLHRWSEHYQDMLYATWMTPEYREVLAYQYSPKEQARAADDPSVEPKTIWEEYHDEVVRDDGDYIFDRLVEFYEASPAAGLGYVHSFGTEQRDQLERSLFKHYGVSGMAELHEYTSQELPLTDQEREFYRWYMGHKGELDAAMEQIPSLPLTLLVQDITGGEYEIPLASTEETQELFVELSEELQGVFDPAASLPGEPDELSTAAVVYIRSDSPLLSAAEDLEQLIYRPEFGGSPERPGNVMYLEVPQMSEHFKVQPITPAALGQLQEEYAANTCICPSDNRVHTRTEDRCELQECSEHPGIFMVPSGPPIFGDMQEKMEEMSTAGEPLYGPAEVDAALEEVEQAIVGAEPNVVVYYALDGPLAQEARTRGGLGILELYTGHTVFLPSGEVTEGFEVVDSIPDESFAKMKEATDAGFTTGLPSLTVLKERGRYVSHMPDAVAEEVMKIDDALDFAASNIIVYYATAGPLAWGISTQSAEVTSLGLYGEDVLFLPTGELSEGFEVVDNIPDEQFAQVLRTPPELSQVYEMGLGVNLEEAEKQFRELIDAVDSAARTGRTPITVEVNPQADFYRYQKEGDRPFIGSLNQWITYLESQYPGIEVGVDVVSDLDTPFLIPTIVSEETEASLLPRTVEGLLEELIRIAQDIPPETDLSMLYMAYADITGQTPESLTDLQVAIMGDPSLGEEIANWLSYRQKERVAPSEVYDALGITEYMAIEEEEEVVVEKPLEIPPVEVPEAPPEPYEPLSEEEMQNEYNNLMERLPSTLDFLAKEVTKPPPKREWVGLQIYVSPSLHGTMRGQLMEGILNAAYERGLPSPQALGIELLTKVPSQLDDEQARAIPIFKFVEAPASEQIMRVREEFDPEEAEQALVDTLTFAEYQARQLSKQHAGMMVELHVHPEFLAELGEEWLHDIIRKTVEPPFDLKGRLHILVDENVPSGGFDAYPVMSKTAPGPGRYLEAPERGEGLPVPEKPSGAVREPAEFPPEVAEEFLAVRKDYDAQMEAAVERAILGLTTQNLLFSGADARALLESGKKRSLRIPEELRQIFFDYGIDVARDTTMRPIGDRDVMLTGKDQAYYVKVSPEGYMDAYELHSDYRDKDDVDDIRDGANAALSFIETFCNEEDPSPDAAPSDIQEYWETRIQPRKPDPFCTGWATIMQLHGIPLTRTINVGDPNRPDVQQSNGRADAVSFIQRSLASTAGPINLDMVRRHLEDVLRSGGMKVTDPYAQGWFEGLGQEGYPPTLLGYPGVLQEEVPIAPVSPELPEELWDFRQQFIEQARGMGYDDEQIQKAIGDPEALRRAYETSLQRRKTSSLMLPEAEEDLLTELISTAQEEVAEPIDTEFLEELVKDVLGPLPEKPPLEPPEPSIETPEEVPPEVEDEYGRIFSTLQEVDWDNIVGVYVYAEPTLYAFTGGTPGIQQDLVDEGWEQEIAERVFVISDESLGPGMMSTVSTIASPGFEETMVFPAAGFRHEETGTIWDGTRWMPPEEQIYEYGDLRFKVLNKPSFGTRELLYPIEVVWAPEKSDIEVGREYTMPLEWLQEAEPVEQATPTGRELAEQLWERGK